MKCRSLCYTTYVIIKKTADKTQSYSEQSTRRYERSRNFSRRSCTSNSGYVDFWCFDPGAAWISVVILMRWIIRREWHENQVYLLNLSLFKVLNLHPEYKKCKQRKFLLHDSGTSGKRILILCPTGNLELLK